MGKAIKFVFIALLAGAALYGGAKGYLYYQVKSTLDDLAQRIRPYGDFRYGDIETDLRGRVVVRDLVMQANEMPEPVVVEQISITGPDVFYALDPRPAWTDEPRELPPRLTVAFDRMRFPFQDQLSISPLGNDPRARYSNCSAQQPGQPPMAAALGLHDVTMNGDFGYEFDEIDGRLFVKMAFELPGVESGKLRLDLTDVSRATLRGESSIPQLRALDASMYVDPAFGNKFALVCGQRNGMTPDVFKAGLLSEQLGLAESGGLTLGPGLRFALQVFFEEWGEMKFALKPLQPVGLMSLAFLPPDRLAQALNLNLKINDTIISDLSFTFEPPVGKTANLGSLLGRTPPPGNAVAPARRVRYENYWSDVAPNRLAGFLDREVRLYSSGQPVRVGTLSALNGGTAEVRQWVHGGRFTAHVPLDTIGRAEVQLRREIKTN